MIRQIALTAALAACVSLPAVAEQAATLMPEGQTAASGLAAGTGAAAPVGEGADAAASGEASLAKPRVGITSEMAEARWTTPAGRAVTVSRDQTPGAVLEGDWALTGRDCPPFCIQPMTPAPGVTTLGEMELIEAMKAGDTILVDGRTPDWFLGGTIPGAINIPFTEAVERLAELGCEPDFDGRFDCANARKVILFCNGIWCGQSPAAIRAMVEAGYPVERIGYYRGGMLAWRLLGLTVAGGGAAAAHDAPGTTAATQNPVVAGTTEEAAASGAAPVAGQAATAMPVAGGASADAATMGDAAASEDMATPGN